MQAVVVIAVQVAQVYEQAAQRATPLSQEPALQGQVFPEMVRRFALLQLVQFDATPLQVAQV